MANKDTWSRPLSRLIASRYSKAVEVADEMGFDASVVTDGAILKSLVMTLARPEVQQEIVRQSAAYRTREVKQRVPRKVA